MRDWMPHRGPTRPVAAALLIATCLVGGPVLEGARAEPGDPARSASPQDRAPAQEKAQARLDAAAAALDDLEIAAGAAAEDYNQARITLHDQELAASAAGAAAQAAARRLEQARRDVGRLAAATYREGGSSTVELLLTPAAPDDLADRAGLLRMVAGDRRRTLRRAESLRATAATLARAAELAASERARAVDRLRQARDRAEQQTRLARERVGAMQQQRESLLAELARARGVSLEQERARQERRGGTPDPVPAPSSTGAPTPSSTSAPAPTRTTRPTPTRTTRPTPTRTTRPTPTPTAGGSTTGGSTTGGSTTGGSTAGTSTGGARAVAWARTQLGIPYEWGGEGPDSYDCSGLTMRAWQRGGVGLPHSSRLQWRTVAKVSYDDLRPGDLIFWASDPSDPGTIHHVAIYAGDGQMVEAPASGFRVRLVPVRWARTMPMAGRP